MPLIVIRLQYFYSGAGDKDAFRIFGDETFVGITGFIVVADDGPGLSPEQLARVFDRFYRADQSRSARGPGGAGLGLSICRTIVEAHGGKIDIASEPGKGTRVSTHVPLNSDAGKSG